MNIRYLHRLGWMLLAFLPVLVTANEGDILNANPQDILNARDKLRELHGSLYGPNIPREDEYEPLNEIVPYEPGTTNQTVQVYLSEFQPTVIQFIDSFGSPWPILEGAKIDSELYQSEPVESVADNSTLVVFTEKSAGFAVLPVFLKGLNTPILLRLDIHEYKHHQSLGIKVMDIFKESKRSQGIMARSTKAARMVTGSDPDLNHVIHGVTPEGAVELNVLSEESTTRAWLKNGELLIRTTLSIFSPQYTSVEHGQNDYTAYRFPAGATRYIGFDEFGNDVQLRIPGGDGG